MLHPKNKSHDSICAKHVDADLVNSPVDIKPVNTNPVDAEGLEGLYHPVDAEGLKGLKEAEVPSLKRVRRFE